MNKSSVADYLRMVANSFREDGNWLFLSGNGIKCKSLNIETNGKTAGTIIKADGKQIGLVQNITLTADVNKPRVSVMMEKIRKNEGDHVLVRKSKIITDLFKVEFEEE